MTRFAEVIRGWLGWCPNARTMGNAPAVRATAPVTINPPVPDGGTVGSGRIDRGSHLAVGSIKILIRNKKLLWFSLLTGIVMLFSLATTLYVQFVSGTNPFPGTNLVMNSPEILIAKGSLLWFVLTFTLGLISTFLTYYLLAGLITCASFILSGKTITIREGLARAWDHRVSLAGWAVIGAFAGTLSSFIMYSWTNTILITFLSMGAILVFFVLTIFVVPAIVLNDEGVLPAIRDSISVFRKMWGEIIVCFGVFFLIAFVIYLVALIPIISLGFSSRNTASAGAASAGVAVILTLLVLIVLIFIGSTVVGIATLGLYEYGTTGIISREFEGKRM